MDIVFDQKVNVPGEELPVTLGFDKYRHTLDITGPDYAVMCILINKHARTHTEGEVGGGRVE